MENLDASLPELSQMIQQRRLLVGHLAESLDSSNMALAHNDAEAIARGASHQAELCRQWSCLEVDLRGASSRRMAISPRGAVVSETCSPETHSTEHENSARLQAEWVKLSARIRYLTRMHGSLLRHLERSLAIMNRVVDSCASTYTPAPALLRSEVRVRVGG
jgi:hypothetical protein